MAVVSPLDSGVLVATKDYLKICLKKNKQQLSIRIVQIQTPVLVPK